MELQRDLVVVILVSIRFRFEFEFGVAKWRAQCRNGEFNVAKRKVHRRDTNIYRSTYTTGTCNGSLLGLLQQYIN